jgi:transcription-repair coupling factor (superfamily II helicase)
MKKIFEKLDGIGNLKTALKRVVDGEMSVSLSGLTGSSRTLVSAWLHERTGKDVLYISAEQESSENAQDDFKAFMGPDKVAIFPSWEIQPYEIRAPHAENIGNRFETLYGIIKGKGGIVCAPAAALMEPTMDRKSLGELALDIYQGETLDIGFLLQRLIMMGFVRRPVVEQLGDFAVRGGLIDIFPATAPEPVRLEFFGDRIDSIRSFSVLTQRSLSREDKAIILPLREISIDMNVVERACEKLSQEEAITLHQALGPDGTFDGLEFFRQLFMQDQNSLLDYLHRDTIVVLDDPGFVREEIRRTMERAVIRHSEKNEYPFGNPDEVYIGYDRIRRLLARYPQVRLRGLLKDDSAAIHISTRPQEPFGSHIKMFADKLRDYAKEGYSCAIFCDGESRRKRLGELLSEYDVAVPLRNVRISAGFAVPDAGFWFLTDHELFARTIGRKKTRGFREGIALSSYQSLQPGDFVVHIDHGIGRYRGLETIVVDGRKRDCLLLIYAGGDKVYVPIEEFLRVQKFAGKEGTPALSRIGSGAWERTKARAKKAIMEMAEELIELYAKRKALPGFAFVPDSQWQKELEASFSFEETPDQQKAIDDIKRDMESGSPMDRLVCGDVGYGKTEVAIRAAFKAVESSKQVAVLVPTTILAQQHLETFRSRLSGFPVMVELLSRFRSPKESKAVKEGLKKGTIDIVIGTHKLLQKDIEFKDLGLLIVDEEQRFGVTHKERIRKLRSQVDTLTLTATPIPRTMQLSLLGARDMSIINTPPKDRLPITTEVSLFSERIIMEAIEREMLRGGQVFFVHNRVESIEAFYRYLERILPMARIVIGHGQMPERRLERVMVDFQAKKYQVLLATTIIESGLDMPSVNTIIMNRADKLGLAQLYQLRGRVGRSSRRAFAYLLVPPLRLMTEKARKRLRAVEEFTELGSGFHLAMKDLEIRGAGNMLGAQQHGFIEEVGFDLYCRLLEEAVAQVRGQALKREKIELKVQTDLDLFIPESYIDNPNLRVEIYRTISEIFDNDRLVSFSQEIRDRFGPFPEAVKNLLDLAASRLLAAKLGASRLKYQGGELTVEFPQEREFAKSEIEGWRNRISGKMDFKSSNGLVMRLVLDDGGGDALRNALQSMVG